jgi:carotenoid cleavage dioxygenase
VRTPALVREEESGRALWGGMAPYLTWSVLDRSGTVTRPATEVCGVDRPLMVHDMAITPTYIVLVLAPLFFDMAALMRGASPLLWSRST